MLSQAVTFSNDVTLPLSEIDTTLIRGFVLVSSEQLRLCCGLKTHEYNYTVINHNERKYLLAHLCPR